MHHFQASPNWTGRTARTSREAFGLSPSEATPIQIYKQPLSTRLFYAIARWGWVILPIALAVSVLSGCADEAATYAADQASLADAIAQAKEAGR